MYGKSLRTYEGTDKSRSPGIPNLNSLPEGRGPLKISRGDFLVNSQMKAENRSSVTRRNFDLTRSRTFLLGKSSQLTVIKSYRLG